MSAVPLVQPIPYYAAPATSGALGAGGSRPLGAARKFAQGAGSALLVFAGADSMTNGAAASSAGEVSAIDFSSLDSVMQTAMSSGLTGPFQIIAAAFLFLAAGRCVSRFFGLIVAAGVLLLYMQGVTFGEVWAFLEHFMQRLAAAASAFQTANVG